MDAFLASVGIKKVCNFHDNDVTRSFSLIQQCAPLFCLRFIVWDLFHSAAHGKMFRWWKRSESNKDAHHHCQILDFMIGRNARWFVWNIVDFSPYEIVACWIRMQHYIAKRHVRNWGTELLCTRPFSPHSYQLQEHELEVLLKRSHLSKSRSPWIRLIPGRRAGNT